MSQNAKEEIFQQLYNVLSNIVMNSDFTPDLGKRCVADCYMVPSDNISEASQLLVKAKEYAS